MCVRLAYMRCVRTYCFVVMSELKLTKVSIRYGFNHLNKTHMKCVVCLDWSLRNRKQCWLTIDFGCRGRVNPYVVSVDTTDFAVKWGHLFIERIFEK